MLRYCTLWSTTLFSLRLSPACLLVCWEKKAPQNRLREGDNRTSHAAKKMASEETMGSVVSVCMCVCTWVCVRARFVCGVCLHQYVPPPPCISYANVRNYYGPYAHCSLDKGIACAKHIQLPTDTCARAWYECTLTSAHISKCMQTQDSLGNMKISGSHPCWHKQ